MSTAPAIKHMTINEYLEFEEAAEEKHEYYQGEVFAMAGASISHNQIVSNTLAEVNIFLKNKSCQIFPSDLKVHNQANTLFTYPDMSIVCGEIERWNEKNDIITNPSVLIEVLSKGTQGYDREAKFWLYRSIPSLKEYILISSFDILIEHYTKQPNGSWNFTETTNVDDQCMIETISFTCLVGDLYRNVVFPSVG